MGGFFVPKLIKCPICSTDDATELNYVVPNQTGIQTIDCLRCGVFTIDSKTKPLWEVTLSQTLDKDRFVANVSGWLYENQNHTISMSDVQNTFSNLKTPSFHERAEKLLFELEKRTKYVGEFVDIIEDELLAITWSINRAEFVEILKFLEHQNRIEAIKDVENFIQKITPNGWAYLEKVKEINPESELGFIAMSFDDDLVPLSTSIRKAIEDAGYKPLRVDDEEHIDKIDDKIIASIRKCRFIIADLTQHKNGVYFEAGFAMGLNIPIFWTCKKTDTGLHFDIRQYNCIFWENPGELEVKLSNRIEGVLGKGKYKP